MKLKRAKLLAARYPVESIFLAILLSHRLIKKRHRKFVFWNLFFYLSSKPAAQAFVMLAVKKLPIEYSFLKIQSIDAF